MDDPGSLPLHISLPAELNEALCLEHRLCCVFHSLLFFFDPPLHLRTQWVPTACHLPAWIPAHGLVLVPVFLYSPADTHWAPSCCLPCNWEGMCHLPPFGLPGLPPNHLQRGISQTRALIWLVGMQRPSNPFSPGYHELPDTNSPKPFLI